MSKGNKGIAKMKQAARQQQAQERQAARNERSVAEQTELLRHRPGNSRREQAKLARRLSV